MAVADIISSITSALVGAITSLVGAIPAGIKNAFEALFFDTAGNTTTVSKMAVVLLVFGGVALAIGLTKLVWHLVRSKVG